MKCPACGFDSADGAQWCDFCKEPFNKKKAPQPVPASPTPAPGPLLPKGAEALIPPEFVGLDAGEKVPTLPRWVRPAAWAIVALWVVWGVALLGYYLGKAQPRQEPVAGQGVSIPVPPKAAPAQ